MSYSLQINLDNASKGLFVNQNPPFYLNVIKDVSVGPNTLASPTTWLVHKVIGGTITVQWNSTYEVYFTSSAIKPGNTMAQSNKTRTPANTGYSYKWDGKLFTVSGQTAVKGAIEVVNATSEPGVFGISQTVNDGIDAISLGVTNVPSNGKVEFTPMQGVTLWMARYANANQSNVLVAVAQLGTHGSLVCLPNVKNEISLNDGRWVVGGPISSGTNGSNGSKSSDKKEKEKEKPEKKKEDPKELKKEEPKKEEPKKEEPKKEDPKKPSEKDLKKPEPTKDVKPAPAVDPKKAAEDAKKKAAEDKKKAAEDKKKAEAEKKKAAEDKKKEEAKKKEEEKKKAAEAKKKADEDKKKAAEDKKKADAAKKSPPPVRKNTEPANDKDKDKDKDKDRRDSKPDPNKVPKKA